MPAVVDDSPGRGVMDGSAQGASGD